MKTILFHNLSLLCLAGFLFAGSNGYSQEQYKIGSAVPAFSANDQFGKPFKLGFECNALMVSFDMATGKRANVELSALGKAFLPEHHAVFMANIHEMPAVGRMFALPKMRSYTHRIILADDSTLLIPFPRREKCVTVVMLQKSKITEIRYWDPEKEEIAKVLAGH